MIIEHNGDVGPETKVNNYALYSYQSLSGYPSPKCEVTQGIQ